jgi:hypothetical protein
MRFTVFRLLRNSPVMIGDVCGRNNNVSPSPFLEAVYFQINVQSIGLPTV